MTTLRSKIGRFRHRLRKQGSKGVAVLGHRNYVGGLWDEVGKLQFNFMVAQGLQKQHTLVDVACGSLRGGVWFIPYLDAGNYLGIEKEADLIARGTSQELSPAVVEAKHPEFVISDSFEFHRFSKKADYAIAQSLFTHLTLESVEQCLTRLRSWSECPLFATFLEVDTSTRNRRRSHAHRGFYYTRGEMECAGERSGWSARYIGDWHHPRGQRMIEYTPR